MEENAEDFSSRISPNAYTYNCVIFCYTWSNMEHKDDKALAMLEKMKEMAETNSFCRPDCTTMRSSHRLGRRLLLIRQGFGSQIMMPISTTPSTEASYFLDSVFERYKI